MKGNLEADANKQSRGKITCDALFTFTAPREVSIVHYPLGGLLWFCRLVVVAYIYSSMRYSYTILYLSDVHSLVAGWTEPGAHSPPRCHCSSLLLSVCIHHDLIAAPACAACDPYRRSTPQIDRRLHCKALSTQGKTRHG